MTDFEASPLLNQQNNIFFRCVEDCHEPIMITDRKGQLIYVNRAWCTTFGYSSDEALGQTPRIIRSEHQPDEFYRKMWSKILNPKINGFRGELINRSKSGEEVPVHLNITPYLSDSGETLGYMGLSLDLRRQKSLEDQVAQQDRLATIGELTSGLAHEIGTPIGVIRGRAEMMQMQVEDLSPLQKSLDIIIKQTDRISTLISSLLRLSRTPNDEPLTNVDLQKVVSEVQELLIQRLRKHNIVLNNNIAEGTVALADRNKVEQILINLVINSVHAIIKNSEANTSAKKQITLSSEFTSDRVVLYVEDTGGGIPQSIIHKIFNPFFTTKPTSEGTGLGLAIVYRIVDELGGFIRVSSNEGEGTIISITLQVPAL